MLSSLSCPFCRYGKSCSLSNRQSMYSLFNDGVRVGTISSALPDAAAHSTIQSSYLRFLDAGVIVLRSFPVAEQGSCGASESHAFEKLAATGEGETESAEAAASSMPGRSFFGAWDRVSSRKRFATCRAFSSVDASSQSPPPV